MLFQLTAELFRKYPGSNDYHVADCEARAQGFSDTELGQIGWQQTNCGKGSPLVLLHDAGDSSTTFQGLMQSLPCHVVAFDLPGHGNSASADQDFDIARTAKALDAACRALGLPDYRVAGEGVGAVIAASMLTQGLTSRALAINPDVDTSIVNSPTGGPINLGPEWDGAHLLRAWRIARWEQLFSPWKKRHRAHAIRHPGSLDPYIIQTRAISLLQAGNHWREALLAAARGGSLLATTPEPGLTLAITAPFQAPTGTLTLPPNREEWVEFLHRW